MAHPLLYLRHRIKHQKYKNYENVYLFNGTVRDNILYGKPAATDEEIVGGNKALVAVGHKGVAQQK